MIDGSLPVPANGYREDLKHAAIGSEHQSFRFTLADSLPFAANAMEMGRSLDKAVFARPSQIGRCRPMSDMSANCP